MPNHIPQPKFKAGDQVFVINPDDPDYHTQRTILGLSPSTRKRRSPGARQWRYHLDNGTYLNETELELLQPIGVNHAN